MISKPVRWRRAGIAALAGISIAVTAIAAQVSPPNVNAVEATDTQGGAKKPGERVAIKLPAATLDRYVGTYKLSQQIFIEVKREGESLIAKITGQPPFEIFPERENYFFWKITDAQLEFSNDGTGSATLHQWGKDFPLTKVDPSEASQAQETLNARIQAQTPMPGSEDAVRRSVKAVEAGHLNYEDMDSMLAEISHKQEAQILALGKQMGAVKSITFKGVGQQGWDSYEVQFANGKLTYAVMLADNGKIAGMMTLALP